MNSQTFTIASMKYNKSKRCTEIIEEKAGDPIIHNLPKEASLHGIARPGDEITWIDEGLGKFTIKKGETLIATYHEKEKQKRDAFYEVDNSQRGLNMLRKQTVETGYGQHNY